MKRTILYSEHLALNAKMVPFSDWEMPLYYKGVVAEHQAVRSCVGLFDVSHMGCIAIRGKEATRFMDYLSTNDIKNKKASYAIYTLLCHETGGCVDDVLVFKRSEEDLFVVVNASNRKKDLAHFLRYQEEFEVSIEQEEKGILALQGPHSPLVLKDLFPAVLNLRPMEFLFSESDYGPLLISRSGYTGELGFEIFASPLSTVHLWRFLLEIGREQGIEPIGLGARDTLRLEAGFALYGHELSDSIFPNETVSSWAIKWYKETFLGKEEIEKREKSGEKRTAYGIKIKGGGIAREGSSVFKEEKLIGQVTSGSFSPSLRQPIALILSSTLLHIGDEVEVEVRSHRVRAQVVNIPFVEKKR